MKIMKKYTKFQYIFPPRAEQTTSSNTIINYDNGDYLAQPKFDGDCAELYINTNEVRNFNRHRKEGIKLFKISNDEILELHSGNGWMVLVGEYMNKNKKGVDNSSWNHKFVIWDIIVYNGEHLIGKTYQERVELLDTLFGKIEYNDYLYKISENIFRVKTFYEDFTNIWNEIVKIDMLEGFVLKRKSGKLTDGRVSKNNHLTAIKCRKQNKNYIF
jgi:ATP-dependent DNA ligase